MLFYQCFNHVCVNKDFTALYCEKKCFKILYSCIIFNKGRVNMSFYIQFGGEELEFFSINEISENLELGRTVITRHLDKIRQHIGDENFNYHIYVGRDPQVNPKKKTTYISKYLKDLVIKQIKLEKDKRAYYHQLPNDRKQLKMELTRLAFLNQKDNKNMVIDWDEEDIAPLKRMNQYINQGSIEKIEVADTQNQNSKIYFSLDDN